MENELDWPNHKTINVIVDPPGWFTPFGHQLVRRLTDAGHRANLFERQRDVATGDIAFYLSCTGLTSAELLARNRWNIVVHASNLPHGRGFSPLTWQILEGANEIPLTMITMAEEADAGDILMQRWLCFEGHELNDEMRHAMGQAICDMCHEVAGLDCPPQQRAQVGRSSWYPRRKPDDSRLDPDRSIAEQFDLLRVVDNGRYPAFFDYRGYRYTLKIERQSTAMHQGDEFDPSKN